MNILDRFLNNFRSGKAKANVTGQAEDRASMSGDVVKTPYGELRLASDKDREQFKSVVIRLQRATDALTRKDIADWRAAWQRAINVESPDRRVLYDIYRDVEVDLHLSGCIEQRVQSVMACSFKLVNEAGDKIEDASHYFDQSWFKHLMRLCLDSLWYGHSLIELGELTKDGDGCVCFDNVSLIPRKHVVPEYHRCVVNVGDDWRSGIDYRESPWCDWLIEAGEPDDLGKFLKAAQQTIPKKNALAFWDAFAEIFGMPMRVVKTTTRDPKEWRRLERMIMDSGSNLGMITGMETEVQFVESGKGDAFNVYDKRIDRANSEISKLIIGQTMTIEDGSSLSQSETHLEVFEHLVESDRVMLRDIVNNQLIPRMIKHGFPLKGLRFEWDDAVDYTPEQQISFETMVADRYEVDPSYFADKYGMPVGERIRQMPLPEDGRGQDEDAERAGKEDNRPFFD